MSEPVTGIETIGKVIQLSVAPVFLLAGVSATLNVLVGRVVRIVERARALEARIAAAPGADAAQLNGDLAVLARRARLINRAITYSVVCAILVPIVVISLFVDALFGIRLELLVAIGFITALASLAVGLLYFLREVFIATASLSFGIRGSPPGT